MKPADDIHKLIRKLQLKASADLDRRVHNDIFTALAESQKTESAVTQPNIWRIIMKSPVTKLAVAAAIIVAVGIVGHYYTGSFEGTTPAFGITEAMDLLRSAKTTHIAGWIYLDRDAFRNEQERKLFPFEEWTDNENGRFRRWKPSGFWGENSCQPMYFLKVSDGQYIMETSVARTRDSDCQPMARFTKLSPLEQELQLNRLRVFGSPLFGPFHLRPDAVEGFVKSGVDEIDGETCHIWRGERTRVGEAVPYDKLEIWVLPSSGRIARVFWWENRRNDTIYWQPMLDIRTVEYNITPPPDCFEIEAPSGHELENTKETAVESRVVLREFGPSQRYYECIGFTLHDGSVVLVWSDEPDTESPQDLSFVGGLAAEGPSTNPPAQPQRRRPGQIIALVPWPAKSDTTCEKHHLAYTEKAGRLYEWSIYVPKGKMPDRSEFLCYNKIQEFEGSESDLLLSYSEPLEDEIQIRSKDDFDRWVLGTMAELSDEGKAPQNVTYEGVLQLAKQTRNSLRK